MKQRSLTRALARRRLLPRSLRRLAGLRALRDRINTDPFTVLLAHNIGRPTTGDFLPASLNTDPTYFAEILNLLRHEANLLPATQLVTAALAGNLPPRAVALTLDDGWRDNFLHALPLLRQHQIPATIFVTSGLIQATTLLPPHRCYLRPGQPEPDPATLYLNRDELRALADAGIEIGAHTRTHPRLADLPAAEQRQELQAGKTDLETWLGRPITTFAYPYGTTASFTPTTRQLVAELFATAFRSDEIPDAALDKLAFPRLNIASFDWL